MLFYIVLYIVVLYCTSVVLHFCCLELSLLLTFAVAHFHCFVFSHTFVVLQFLFFRTFAVLYFRFVSLFFCYFVSHIYCFVFCYLTLILFCLSVSMFPSTYDPGFYVPRYLCSLVLCSQTCQICLFANTSPPTLLIPHCLYVVSYLYFCCLVLLS